MISRIKGKIKSKHEHSLLVDIGGLTYEVLVPVAIMKGIDKLVNDDGEVELVTYYYHQLEPSRSLPILIGFSNEVEKEFFEQFISVSGIGPKAAVKALTMPISVIAEGIDRSNHALLQTLPGIGKQRAKDIVAKLEGKVGKFGLIQDKDRLVKEKKPSEDTQKEALQVLMQLQYKRQEAEKMLYEAFSSNPGLKSVEEVLNEIYKQRSKKEDK